MTTTREPVATAGRAAAVPAGARGPRGPRWPRARLWLALAALVVLAALAITALTGSTGRPLDPASPSKGGSKALAVLLRHYGATVRSGDSIDTARRAAGGASVVVTAPDDYSVRQLRQLRDSAALLVLVDPGPRAAAAVADGVQASRDAGVSDEPRCSLPGPQAAGRITVPSDATSYTGGAASCYHGLLVTAPKVAVLGSADLLRNDHLAGAGIAALDVNVLTADRSLSGVHWLLPGGDAAGSGPTTVWALFPPGVHRAFWWVLGLGALVVVWRARRFGRVVTEPLPVVVRAAELVEGHGRLYRRAQARDRAAAALRAGTRRRLTTRLALPPGADAAQVAAAVTAATPLWQRSAAQTHQLLADAPVADDAQLLRLAQELDQLTAAAHATGEGRSTT